MGGARLRLHVTETKRSKTWILWVLLVGVVLVSQWSSLKIGVYRMLGKPPPNDNIAWRTDYVAALEESKRTGKPVFLNFTADWCPPCQVMKWDVWPNEDVRQALESKYIPVYLDADLPTSSMPGARYGVETIPTFIIADGEGRALKEGGPMGRREMVAFLGGG
jgi:thiol:disulfide interchange protein